MFRFSQRQQPYLHNPYSRNVYGNADDEYSHYAEQQRQQQQQQHSYIDRMRRAREMRELEAAQARRRAAEEDYLEQLARARAEEEYRQRLQQQRKCQEQRRHLEMQARAAEAAEKQRRREIRSAYNDDLASSLFGHLFSAPSPRKHLHQHRNHDDEADTQSLKHKEPSPVVEVTPLPIEPEQQRTQQEKPSMPKMQYETALRIVQQRGKQALLIRRRLRTLKSSQDRFDSLKSVFADPERLDYNPDKSSAKTPVLAFTPLNRPLQAYEESLTRLLVELDDVPSQGSRTVKAERKQLVRNIEAELARLDALKVDIFNRQQASPSSPINADVHDEQDVARSSNSRSASPAPSLASEDGSWDSLSETDVDDIGDSKHVASLLVADIPSAKTLDAIAAAEKVKSAHSMFETDEDDAMHIEVLL